jgi:L-2,4-diaminobutyrate transaminase
VLGTGGIVPPPRGYWEKIQAVLSKHDIRLVADEVITGFGRLGSMFGSDHYGIRPDLITIAKGLTSAYAPLSGVIVSEKVWRVLEKGSEALGAIGHGWTYSAHPLCAAAGVANLELIDKLDLVRNAREVGAYFNKTLAEALADHPMVGDVRGEGLLAAVEFVADKEDCTLFDPALKIGPRIAAAALERGVIGRVMPQGDILGFAPPLCITRAEVDTVVAAARDAVDAVSRTLESDARKRA